MPDYVSPIIDAMVKSVQAKQAAAQLEQRKQEALAEQQYRIDALKQAKEIADSENKLRQAENDWQHKLESFKLLQGSIQAGAKPPEYASGSPDKNIAPVYSLPGLSDARFPVGMFATPEQQLLNKAQETSTIEGIKSGFRTKEQQAEFDNQLKLLGTRYNQDIVKLGVELNAKARENKLDRETQFAIAQMRDSTDRYTAGLSYQAKLRSGAEGSDFNASSFQNYINDIYITGNTDESSVPSKLRPVIKGVVPPGWTPLKKEDNQRFESVAGITDIINAAKDLANEASLGTGFLGIGGPIASWSGFTQAGELKNRVAGRLGELARYFGKEVGPKTQKDIERAGDAVFSGRLTVAQNLENINYLEQTLKKAGSIVISKYNPDQAEAILTKRGIDPRAWGITPKQAQTMEEYVTDPKTGKLVLKQGGK